MVGPFFLRDEFSEHAAHSFEDAPSLCLHHPISHLSSHGPGQVPPSCEVGSCNRWSSSAIDKYVKDALAGYCTNKAETP